jgi:hypothetical protein
MDTTELVVGQEVYMRSGEVGGWAKVVEVTPTGVTVVDSEYGEQLSRFDKDGVLVGDSSAVCTNTTGLDGPFKLYLNTAPFMINLDTTNCTAKEAAMRLISDRTREHKERMARKETQCS